MFMIPSTVIHRCLKHEGVLGKGKDFITETPCLVHLYSSTSKQKFGVQVYQNVSKEFCERKIENLTNTIIKNYSPNTSRIVGFSKYSHSNKLVDLSILYDLGSWYGLSLENIIKTRIKTNTQFKETQIMDFLLQMIDVIDVTGKATFQYLQMTPVNIFATPESRYDYSFFPNNFGFSFSGTQWEKFYHNPNDKFWKERSIQNSISAVLFMVGMIALQMCTLHESSTIYDNNKLIDEKILLKSLQSIKLTFSSNLYQVISRLCTFKQDERMTLKELSNQQSILSKLRKGRTIKEEIKQGQFQGHIINDVPIGRCQLKVGSNTYIGNLNSNFRYNGYGVLVTLHGDIYRGEFIEGQFINGEYYKQSQYIFTGIVDTKGFTNGFKVAISGNKDFLYMTGIFNSKKQLYKGKIVYHNGKSKEVDLSNRPDISRLSGVSLNLSKFEFQK